MPQSRGKSLVTIFIGILCCLLLATCYDLILDHQPPKTPFNDVLQDQEDQQEAFYEPPAAPDPVIARFLSSIHGDPQLLTLQELYNLRKNTPGVVNRFLSIINSEGLSEEVRNGRVSTDQLRDLHNSMIFLNSEKCHTPKFKQSENCLIIKKTMQYPKEGLSSARLSGFVYPWVNLNNIFLTVYLYNPTDRHFRGETFHLKNITAMTGNNINGRELDRDLDVAVNSHITWDITIVLQYLRKKLRISPYPIVMLLTCPGNTLNMLSGLPWQHLSNRGVKNSQVLVHGSQAVLEIHSKTTENILQKYSTYEFESKVGSRTTSQDIRFKRSTEGFNQCPSFLDKNRQHTKCCLFRFVLNKEQIESNDKLRFIVFPNHLPMNVCHGRCIGKWTGVDTPTMKMHSFLMNQYFAGLSDEDRQLIYEAMPCCSASKARNFTIVFKDINGDLVSEDLPAAIKEECSCN